MQKSLHSLLRENTREQHERLHEIVEVEELLASSHAYGAALQAYYRAIAPLEQFLLSLQATEHTGEMPDAAARLKKTDWLRADLAALGRAVPELVERVPPDPFAAFPEATYVGFAYVLEGMTLGAMQISKSIQQQLQLTAENGARFFTGYGSQTREMWQQFQHYLADLSLPSQSVVSAAQFAFSKFEQELAAYRELSVRACRED